MYVLFTCHIWVYGLHLQGYQDGCTLFQIIMNDVNSSQWHLNIEVLFVLLMVLHPDGHYLCAWQQSSDPCDYKLTLAVESLHPNIVTKCYIGILTQFGFLLSVFILITP